MIIIIKLWCLNVYIQKDFLIKILMKLVFPKNTAI